MTALMRWEDVRAGLFDTPAREAQIAARKEELRADSAEYAERERLETPDVERRGGERPDWDNARPRQELPEIPGYDPPHEDDYRPDAC